MRTQDQARVCAARRTGKDDPIRGKKLRFPFVHGIGIAQGTNGVRAALRDQIRFLASMFQWIKGGLQSGFSIVPVGNKTSFRA